MSRLNELLIVKENERKAILEHFGESEKEFEEKIEIIKQWALKSPHIPNELVNYDGVIRSYLVNGKLSIARTKKSIEGFLTMKALYPELYAILIPNTDIYQRVKSYCVTLVMPKLTPDLCRITFYKIQDLESECEDAALYIFLVNMMAVLRVNTDFYLSNIIIIDHADSILRNSLKFTIPFAQKLVNLFLASDLRIKAVYNVNVPPFVEHIYNTLKPVMPKKLVERTHFSQNSDILLDYIPLDCLPSDYGGTDRSTKEIYDDWYEELKYHEDYFRKIVNINSDINLKTKENDSYEVFGIGTEGSFKKLNID